MLHNIEEARRFGLSAELYIDNRAFVEKMLIFSLIGFMSPF
jgi:hypothetical protein